MQNKNSLTQDKRIRDIVKQWLLVLVVAAFAVTILVMGYMHTMLAENNADKMLILNVGDVKQDIQDASDKNLLNLANKIVEYIDSEETLFGEPLFMDILEEYREGSTEEPGDELKEELAEKPVTILEEEFAKEAETEHREKPEEVPLEEDGRESPEDLLLKYLKDIFDVEDIVIVDEKGIITNSTDKGFINFDMNSGEQSGEFICLLNGTKEYVQEYRPMTINGDEWRKFAGVTLKKGGFIQVSYGSERFQKDIDEDVIDVTKNRHVGESGYIMIIDDSGVVVSSPYQDTVGKNISEFGYNIESLEGRADGKPFTQMLGSTEYKCLGDWVEGYLIFAVLPSNEILITRNTTLSIITILEAIIFIAMFWIIYRLLKMLVVDNIQNVTDSLDQIAKGNLDVVVDVRSNKEFNSLSDDINQTVDTLKQHIAAEAAKINAELEYAKNIQKSALPTVFPPYPNVHEFELHATMAPAKEVGGDFFDFELMQGRKLGFCVADVSGKGIPAALFMMRAKTLIKSYGVAGMDVQEIMAEVNHELCNNNEAGMFVTCWLGLMDIETGVLTYCNAGHNPPLLCSEGKYEFIKDHKPNFVLAGMDGVRYEKHEICLCPHDELFLYTDGVTEATNANNELYGEQRLLEILDKTSEESCENICRLVREDIDKFVGEAPQFDDITMFSLRFNGSENIFTTDADISNYDEIMTFIDERLKKLECPAKEIARINVAADEIIANVINYAYGDSLGKITVRIDETMEKSGVEITFSDRGVPFNPLDRKDPDTSLSAENRAIGGLGIYMVKKTMDKVEYEYVNSSNNLKITKYYEKQVEQNG